MATTSPDVATLEREAADARARLADTLERLTSPQTTQAAKQELTDYALGVKESVIGSGRSRAMDLRNRALANPLGLALIGAGIGWHLYRHPPITTLLVGTGIAMLMKGDDGRRFDASAYRDPYDPAQPRGYVPGGVAGYGYPVEENPPGVSLTDRASAAASHAGHVAQDLKARALDAAHDVAERVSETAEAARAAVSGAVETTREAVMGAADTARTTVSGAAGSARSTTSDMIGRGNEAWSQARATTVRGAGTAVDMAQRNPLLLGVLGVAAGTALMYALRSAQDDERYPGRRYARRDGFRHVGAGARYRSPDARSAGGPADERIPHRETRGGGRVSETAGGLAASAAGMASGVADTASRALGAAGEAVASSASSAYGAASTAARSAADVAYSAARRAPQAPAYVSDQIAELGERYPLLLGAVSIAVGAAVGGALRLSEGENRLMGPLSDRLKQRAREAADEQYHLAREAAEHFAGELQTRFAGDGSSGNGQDQDPGRDRSADFETVLGGGQPPVAGGASTGASKAPLGGSPSRTIT